jgi:hypothetical protein
MMPVALPGRPASQSVEHRLEFIEKAIQEIVRSSRIEPQATASSGSYNPSNVAITGGSITGITDLAVADGGTGASTAANARTNLGLGTIATQAASAVAITGGSVTGITDITIADGGTGASSASAARTNLGLGTAATQDTGTSGDTIPVLNSANTWGAVQTFSAGSSSLPGVAVGAADTGVYKSGTFVGLAAEGVSKFRVAGSSAYCQPVYDNTTASAANVQVASDGRLSRSTSSLRYKQDVRNLDITLAKIASLRPVLYKSRQVAQDGTRDYAGLISEEVNSAGLSAFVEFNGEGKEEGIAYAPLAAVIAVNLAKHAVALRTRILDLEARVAALETSPQGSAPDTVSGEPLEAAPE